MACLTSRPVSVLDKPLLACSTEKPISTSSAIKGSRGSPFLGAGEPENVSPRAGVGTLLKESADLVDEDVAPEEYSLVGWLGLVGKASVKPSNRESVAVVANEETGLGATTAGVVFKVGGLLKISKGSSSVVDPICVEVLFVLGVFIPDRLEKAGVDALGVD